MQPPGTSPKASAANKPLLWILIGILAIAIIVFIIAVTGGFGNNTTDPSAASSVSVNPGADSNTPGVSLDPGWMFIADRTMPHVTGYVSNDTDEDITGWISITFNAYDAQGASLRPCIQITNQIDAHGKWKFTAYCGEGDTDTVKFQQIRII